MAKQTEFKASAPGCPVMFFTTARGAQQCVKTIIENGQAVRGEADASGGDHWRYRIDGRKIVRTKHAGNIL